MGFQHLWWFEICFKTCNVMTFQHSCASRTRAEISLHYSFWNIFRSSLVWKSHYILANLTVILQYSFKTTCLCIQNFQQQVCSKYHTFWTRLIYFRDLTVCEFLFFRLISACCPWNKLHGPLSSTPNRLNPEPVIKQTLRSRYKSGPRHFPQLWTHHTLHLKIVN